MKRNSRALGPVFFKAASAISLAVISTLGHAACSSGPGNVCPIKGPGGIHLFDQCFGGNPFDPKPTSVGKDACRALASADKLGDALGSNASRVVNAAVKEVDTRVKALELGTVREFEDTVKDSAKFFANIQKRVNALANDSQCGVNSSLKSVQSALSEDIGKLQTLLATGPKLLQLAEIGGQAALRSGQLLQSIGVIANDITKGGKEASAELAKLKGAAETFDRAIKELVAPDAAGSVAVLIGDVGTLGVALGSVGACASSVYAGIVSLGAASGGGGGGAAACVETAGAGCVVSAASLGIGGAGTAIATALATPACAALGAASAKIPADLATIEKVINGSVQSINAVFKAAEAMQSSAQALAKLAESMPRESEGALRRVASDINAIAASLERAGDLVERDLVPTVTRVTQSVFSDTVKRTQLAYTCFDKAVDVGSDLAMDFGDLIKEHNVAAKAAHEAGKLAADLQRRLANAGEAAQAAATKDWNKLKDEDRRLHREIWGVSKGTVDLARTGAHLVSLAGNPRKVEDIAEDLVKMLDKEVKLVAHAIDAGVDGLLEPAKLKPVNDAIARAKVAVRKQAIEKAKALAKASMEAKARQKNLQLAAGTLRTLRPAVATKIVVPDLKVAARFTGKAGG